MLFFGLAIKGCASQDDLARVDQRLTYSLQKLDQQNQLLRNELAHLQDKMQCQKPMTMMEPAPMQPVFPPETLRLIEHLLRNERKAIRGVSKSIRDASANQGLHEVADVLKQQSSREWEIFKLISVNQGR